MPADAADEATGVACGACGDCGACGACAESLSLNGVRSGCVECACEWIGRCTASTDGTDDTDGTADTASADAPGQRRRRALVFTRTGACGCAALDQLRIDDNTDADLHLLDLLSTCTVSQL